MEIGSILPFSHLEISWRSWRIDLDNFFLVHNDAWPAMKKSIFLSLLKEETTTLLENICKPYHIQDYCLEELIDLMEHHFEESHNNNGVIQNEDCGQQNENNYEMSDEKTIIQNEEINQMADTDKKLQFEFSEDISNATDNCSDMEIEEDLNPNAVIIQNDEFVQMLEIKDILRNEHNLQFFDTSNLENVMKRQVPGLEWLTDMEQLINVRPNEKDYIEINDPSMAVMFMIKVNQQNCCGMVDSGANISIMPEATYETFFSNCPRRSSPHTAFIAAVDDFRLRVEGIVEVTVEFNGLTVLGFPFKILRNAKQLILGRDFMHLFKVGITIPKQNNFV